MYIDTYIVNNGRPQHNYHDIQLAMLLNVAPLQDLFVSTVYTTVHVLPPL